MLGVISWSNTSSTGYYRFAAARNPGYCEESAEPLHLACDWSGCTDAVGRHVGVAILKRLGLRTRQDRVGQRQQLASPGRIYFAPCLVALRGMASDSCPRAKLGN